MAEFSWKQSKIDALNKKIRRARIQAKAQHTDYKRLHPDEARDASQGKFTLLDARVRKEVKDYQDKVIQRRMKRVGQ